MSLLLRQLPQLKVIPEFIPFDGGLDIVTPQLMANPSTCRDASNIIQDINGGNQTMFGYERYDGQPAPSDAVYAILPVTLTDTVAVGDVVEAAPLSWSWTFDTDIEDWYGIGNVIRWNAGELEFEVRVGGEARKVVSGLTPGEVYRLGFDYTYESSATLSLLTEVHDHATWAILSNYVSTSAPAINRFVTFRALSESVVISFESATWPYATTEKMRIDNVTLALAENMVNAGEFAGYNYHDWTEGTGWSYGTGANEYAVATAGSASSLSPLPVLNIEIGKTYSYSFDLTRTAGSITVTCGGDSTAAISASGTYTGTFTAVSTANLSFDKDAAFAGTLDNVVLLESPSPYINPTAEVAYVGTDFLVITKATGLFKTGNIDVSGSSVGTCVGPQIIDGAETPKLSAYYRNAAADIYRADITAVPGSGPVLGVVSYKDVVYAFRNHTDGLSTKMWKESTSGWSAVSLGYEIDFTSGGTYEIEEGDTITGATSTETATVERVIVTSGDWTTGDAAGRLILSSPSGAFESENLNVEANLNVATIGWDVSAITFSVPSGRFEFVITNFTGSTDTIRLYGVDGKNRGWEFDGSVFVPIETGMTTDNPRHIFEHKGHLFYSFLGSVQHSAPGDPYTWNVVIGAGEIGLGDTVTGFMSQPGSDGTATLAIFTRNSIAMLYGASVDDWLLVPFKKEAGAIEHTIQLISSTMMLDDRGLATLATSQNFGNFADATVSQKIQPWLTTRRSLATASCVLRDKNIYTLFFSDNSGLSVTLDNGKIKAMLPLELQHAVRCAWSSEWSDGVERAFFGDDDGYVHQLNKGTSFDGENISWTFSMAYNHSKSPTRTKRYRGLTLEVDGNGYSEFDFTYSLGYGNSDIAQPEVETSILSLVPSSWDSFVWDSFFWDGTSLTPTYARLSGSAENISLIFKGESDYFDQIRFSGALLQYTPTREKR